MSESTPTGTVDLITRHLIVALERLTANRPTDAQRNIEYARARLANILGGYPPPPDIGEEGNFS